MELITALCLAAAAGLLVALPLFPRLHRHRSSKRGLLIANLGLFGLVIVVSLLVSFSGMMRAAETEGLHPDTAAAASTGSDYGLAFLSAALATGIGSIGAGIAVAAAAPAAIGALSEDSSTFGKAMIFVGLGEGLAIFGLLVSILILQKVP